MIPGYQTTCKKIKLDFLTTHYYRLIEQFKTEDGRYRCPFCNTALICQDPLTYFDTSIACFPCEYDFLFTFDEINASFRAIRYRGAKLTIRPIPNKTSVELTYEPKATYRNHIKNTKHTWKARSTSFDMKELFNNINLLDLRVQAVVREQQAKKNK